jgi:hypothetical protein
MRLVWASCEAHMSLTCHFLKTKTEINQKWKNNWGDILALKNYKLLYRQELVYKNGL